VDCIFAFAYGCLPGRWQNWLRRYRLHKQVLECAKLRWPRCWLSGKQVQRLAEPIGTALEPRNVTRKFHVLLAGVGLPTVRFHDLRHTAATLLLAQGVDPRTIMETLGHSQISLTLNTYSHVLPALQEDAAAKLDAILTR